MRIRVHVLIESDQEATPPHVEEVACFERDHLSPATLGLRLDEAKQMLAGVQQVMTAQQIEDYVEQQCQRSAGLRRRPIQICGLNGSVRCHLWRGLKSLSYLVAAVAPHWPT